MDTLRRRADFVAAASSASKFIKPSVIVQCRVRAEHEAGDVIRVGFTATRKLGNAVIRNRVKRRLRAAARELLPQWGVNGRDYVFIGRAQTSRGSFDDLIRDMKHALKRLADSVQPSHTTGL